MPPNREEEPCVGVTLEDENNLYREEFHERTTTTTGWKILIQRQCRSGRGETVGGVGAKDRHELADSREGLEARDRKLFRRLIG